MAIFIIAPESASRVSVGNFYISSLLIHCMFTSGTVVLEFTIGFVASLPGFEARTKCQSATDLSCCCEFSMRQSVVRCNGVLDLGGKSESVVRAKVVFPGQCAVREHMLYQITVCVVVLGNDWEGWEYDKIGFLWNLRTRPQYKKSLYSTAQINSFQKDTIFKLSEHTAKYSTS